MAEYRRTVTDNPFIPITPTRRQALFLTYPVQEILYGGAAGGGKSIALLAAALQYVESPGYAAVLLRRTFADLNKPKALIPLSHEWLQGTGAKWNDNEHQWTFPSGATVGFGYLASENDKYQYQGAAYHFVGWDELTQFTETQYRYLFSRRRKTAGDNVPTRFRAASNPGGVGHEWVRTRFIDGVSDRMRFISARLEDNPYLDQQDYEESLNELDPVTRAQLRHGDWKVRPEGNLFKAAWFDKKIIEERPKVSRAVRYWDLAASEPSDVNPDPDFTAGVLMAEDGDGFTILDAQEFRATPAERDRRIRQTAHADGYDVDIYVEQEPGSSGKAQVDQFQRVLLKGFSVYGVRSTGDKITRAKPFSAACENGLVRLFRGPWVQNFIGRLTSFGMKGAHDDMTDASAGAHRALTRDDEPWSEEDVQELFDGEGESLDGDTKRESGGLTLHQKLMASAGREGQEI